MSTPPTVHPLGTWVRPAQHAEGFPKAPGIVAATRNLFCASIPDYQRVTVRWPGAGCSMEGAAWHFVAVEAPAILPDVDDFE